MNDELGVDLDEDDDFEGEDGDEENLEDLEGDEIKPADFFRKKAEEDEEEEMGDEEIENDVFDEAREMLMNQDPDTGNLEEESNKKNEKRNYLENEIDRLESKLLEKKTWQMQGEVKANQRPVNSLLEEHLDFKSGVKFDSDLPVIENIADGGIFFIFRYF